MKNLLRISSFALSATLLAWGFNACTPVEPAGVSFSSISDMGYESSGNQTVTITMDKSIGSDVTFEFTFSGTAISSSDYGFSTTEATIPAGSTSTDISFFIYDNYQYDPTDKTIIINLTSISGPGVDDAEFGENTTYTYTLMEDDMQIDLSWTPNSGSATDHDIDLYLDQGSADFRASTSGSAIIETVMLYGDDADATYYAISHYYSGYLANSDVNYSITLSFPDGSTQSHSDTFTYDEYSDRTLWGITKSGATYSVEQDPFGANGRISASTKTRNK